MAKHDDGSGVIAYDSFEEMMEDQRQAHDAAMENMTASQRAIPVGGYACNLIHLHDLGPIFGAIQSVEEVRAWHVLYYGIGDTAVQEAAVSALEVRGIFPPPNYPRDPASEGWKEDGYATADDAVDDAVRNHLASWENGYLFGNWFSNMEPDGELGSAHASVCVVIDAEVYQDAFAHKGYVSQASADKIAAAMKVVRAEMLAREAGKEVADNATDEGEGDDSREER